jgi:hypothetical protein
MERIKQARNFKTWKNAENLMYVVGNKAEYFTETVRLFQIVSC